MCVGVGAGALGMVMCASGLDPDSRRSPYRILFKVLSLDIVVLFTFKIKMCLLTLPFLFLRNEINWLKLAGVK